MIASNNGYGRNNAVCKLTFSHDPNPVKIRDTKRFWKITITTSKS